MIASYSVRLICLCFAVFFLVYVSAGAAIAAMASAWIRQATRMRPARAARFLLVLRLFPLFAALFAVFGLCIPNYLRLEPMARAEQMGPACLVAALAGGIILIIALARTLRAGSTSFGLLRRCRRLGRQLASPEKSLPVWVIDGEAPLIGLAGIFRPRVVLSQGVLQNLPSEQLDAALCHERAHWSSRDNLKRLMLLFAPDPFPFLHSLAAVEHAWAKFTEWAADDRAVDGDPARSLSLASALVCVARMKRPARLAPPLVSLVSHGEVLSIRVDRLLCPAPPAARRRHDIDMLPGTLLGLSLMFALILEPAAFFWLHAILEQFVHLH